MLKDRSAKPGRYSRWTRLSGEQIGRVGSPRQLRRPALPAIGSSVITALLLLAACSADDKEARRHAAGPAPTREALARVASASAGASLFNRCAACHSIRRDAPDRDGPNLFGVMGHAIGHNSAQFAYTTALQQVGGRWTPERMDAWLANPRRFAPGTAMTFAGLPDPLDRADVIAYLETQR